MTMVSRLATGIERLSEPARSLVFAWRELPARLARVAPDLESHPIVRPEAILRLAEPVAPWRVLQDFDRDSSFVPAPEQRRVRRGPRRQTDTGSTPAGAPHIANDPGAVERLLARTVGPTLGASVEPARVPVAKPADPAAKLSAKEATTAPPLDRRSARQRLEERAERAGLVSAFRSAWSRNEEPRAERRDSAEPAPMGALGEAAPAIVASNPSAEPRSPLPEPSSRAERTDPSFPASRALDAALDRALGAVRSRRAESAAGRSTRPRSIEESSPRAPKGGLAPSVEPDPADAATADASISERSSGLERLVARFHGDAKEVQSQKSNVRSLRGERGLGMRAAADPPPEPPRARSAQQIEALWEFEAKLVAVLRKQLRQAGIAPGGNKP